MDIDRLARWRPVAWSLGAALLVVAAVVLVLTVVVHANGAARSCGSGWDVVAGRSGWQQWWALDQADPAPGSPMLRSQQCPGAVNARIVTAAAFATGALVALSAAAVVGAHRRITGEHGSPARRVMVLGLATTALGIALIIGGVVGLVLLVADPNATLFLYVRRPTVVLLGLVLLLPAVLLVVLGRGASALAEHLRDNRTRDEPS